MASPLRWRRRRTGPALALAAALAAAGCASAAAGTAVTSANARAVSVPSITTAQAGQVFDHYVAATTEAFKTDDSPLALSVTTGAAQANLSAELKADRALTVRDASGTGGASAYRGSLTITPDIYTYGTPTFYRPEPSGYPRFFVAAVARAVKGANPAAGTGTVVGGARLPVDGRVLMVFQQAAADGPWQLASTAQFPAGVRLPPLATDANGDIPQVPLTATNLLAQPYAVGPLQAAVVDDGPASAAAKSVAAGPLTTGLYQGARDRSDTGLQVPAGDIYQWAMEGTDYPAFALRTADGGALVLYSMYLNSTVAVPSYINKAEPQVPGPAIEIPLPLFLLLRPNQPAPHVELEEQDLFSFAAIDPPAPTAKLHVLATGGALNYASAS